MGKRASVAILEFEVMSEWLDTETKALLQHVPPEKYAPAATGRFTLVLLKDGRDATRVKRSLTKVPSISDERATKLMSQSRPQPIAGALSLADAFLGQFELVCSDSVSVFLRDEVILSAWGDYLPKLYAQVQSSSEFEDVVVTVGSIPSTEEGRRVVDQFFGGVEQFSLDPLTGYSYRGIMMRKKARIMAHWARKIGAEVTIAGES